VLRQNYISGSSMHVVIDVLSVMAAYCGHDTENIYNSTCLCVCVGMCGCVCVCVVCGWVCVCVWCV